MSKIGEQITIVAVGIVSVAIVAVIVSGNSNTSNVLGAIGKAFNASLGAAIKPVTGVGSLG